MKDDFCMDIRCIYCLGRNGQHTKDCLLNEATIFCSHCGSKNHKSHECPTHKPISHVENLQYIFHENSSPFISTISTCSNCGGRHETIDCPKRNILSFTEKNPIYKKDMLIEEIPKLTSKCTECGCREGHTHGCSQFVLNTLREGMSRGHLTSPIATALGAEMLQASQAQDPMQLYQELRAQVEVKYSGQIPRRLREALDTVEKELTDLVVNDLMIAPKDKPLKFFRYNS